MVVIGLKNCGRCQMVKRIFDDRKFEYEYRQIDEFSEEEQKKFFEIGRKAKKGKDTYPLIFDSEMNLLDFQEIIKI